jgi:hypothetical protein
VKVVGTGTSPTFVIASVTFSSGAVAVTAAELGLSVIYGFAASAMGATDGRAAAIDATDTYDAAGVTSLALKCHEAAHGGNVTDLDKTFEILFWGK